MPDSGRTYFILNKKSGTAFDLSGADQKSIVGSGLHKGDNQKWRLVDHGYGWTLQSVYNGKYLDLDTPGVPKDGVRVVAIHPKNNNSRRWDIRRDELDSDGWRIFDTKDPKQNVDLSDHGNPAPGTPVTLWRCWKGENQIWKFEQVPD